MIDLERALSGKRYDGVSFFERGINNETLQRRGLSDGIKVYQEDIQRVVYASCFRRLQNKTQVHPLPSSDYLRNRLTHTLEVSEIGQLIANAVARHLDAERKLPNGVTPEDVKDIVATACLIHDIGNPPFGHNGEEAIQSWFQNNKDLEIVKKIFENPNVREDMHQFDGNAQTFRVVNRTQNWRNEGGLRLSLAAIGASVKYPWASIESSSRIGKKKFGFMHIDAHIFRSIFNELGLYDNDLKIFVRHPLAYIVEAADDIAYLTTDIEDGFRKGSIKYKKAKKLLFNCSSAFHRKRLEDIEKFGSKEDVIAYLRSSAISSMADQAFSVFVNQKNLDLILRGKFKGSLLSNSNLKSPVSHIKNECMKNLYTVKDKLYIEAGGHYMIEKMLDIYMDMANEIYLNNFDISRISKRSKNIFFLLPKEIINNNFQDEDETTLAYLLVDYVSGMTDTYIQDLFNKFTGIKMK